MALGSHWKGDPSSSMCCEETEVKLSSSQPTERADTLWSVSVEKVAKSRGQSPDGATPDLHLTAGLFHLWEPVRSLLFFNQIADNKSQKYLQCSIRHHGGYKDKRDKLKSAHYLIIT